MSTFLVLRTREGKKSLDTHLRRAVAVTSQRAGWQTKPPLETQNVSELVAVANRIQVPRKP